MRLDDDALWSAAERFVAERLSLIDDTRKARAVLDALLAYLAALGYGDEDTFGIHLAAEEAIMQHLRKRS